jgi:hypothetical protein
MYRGGFVLGNAINPIGIGDGLLLIRLVDFPEFRR